jgi:hypothetical protein
MAGNAMHRAAAQSAQPPNWSDFTSLNLVPSPKALVGQWQRPQINANDSVTSAL